MKVHFWLTVNGVTTVWQGVRVIGMSLDVFEARVRSPLSFRVEAETAVARDVEVYRIPPRCKHLIEALTIVRQYRFAATHDRPDEMSRERFFHLSVLLEKIFSTYDNELDEELEIPEEVLDELRNIESRYRIDVRAVEGVKGRWLADRIRDEGKIPGKEFYGAKMAEYEAEDELLMAEPDDERLFSGEGGGGGDEAAAEGPEGGGGVHDEAGHDGEAGGTDAGGAEGPSEGEGLRRAILRGAALEELLTAVARNGGDVMVVPLDGGGDDEDDAVEGAASDEDDESSADDDESASDDDGDAG